MIDTAPWVMARVRQILAIRRRCNASGQDGPDIANIIAALTAQQPAIGAQLELFA